MSAQFIVTDHGLPIRFVSVNDGRAVYCADAENPSVFESVPSAWLRVREYRLNVNFVSVEELNAMAQRS